MFNFKISGILVIFSVLGVDLLFSPANNSFAATVLNCDTAAKTCKVKLEDGFIGSPALILNKQNTQIIAQGKLIKKTGAFGTISLEKVKGPIQKGFTVIIDVDSETSNLQWAAGFPYDN